MKTGNILLLIGLLLCTSSFLTACNFRVQENGRKRTLFDGTVYAQNTAIRLVPLEGQEILCGDSLAGRFVRSGFFLKDSKFIRSHIWQYRPASWRLPGVTSDFDDLEEGYSYWILNFYSLPDVQRQRRIQSRLPIAILSGATIIPTTDPAFLLFLQGWEWVFDENGEYLDTRQHLFAIDLLGQITHLEGITLPYSRDINGFHTVTSITHIGNNDFIYQHDSLIVRALITEKDSFVDTFFHIPYYPHRGHLLVNVEQNRMVFAHRFQHLFQIMDLRADTVKTVDLNNGVRRRYDRRYQYIEGPIPNPNTMYFVDAFAGENYFYLLFWGHNTFREFNALTRGDQWQAATRWRFDGFEPTVEVISNTPAIVEQYDWNGNHVARYMLKGNPVNRFNGFWVDERMQHFYLLAEYCPGGWRRCVATLMVYSFCQE